VKMNAKNEQKYKSNEIHIDIKNESPKDLS
jgi:hypothetical protein